MCESDEDAVDLFQEPDDWKPAEKTPTFTEYVLQSGEKLNLRLVGHNPLWVSSPSRFVAMFASFGHKVAIWGLGCLRGVFRARFHSFH